MSGSSSAIGVRLLSFAVEYGDAYLTRVALISFAESSVPSSAALQEILSTSKTSVPKLQAVAGMLAECGEFDALERLLDNPSGDVRLHVGRLFAKYGAPADIETLERYLALESDAYIIREVNKSLAASSQHADRSPRTPRRSTLTELDLCAIRLLCEQEITWRDAPHLVELLQQGTQGLQNIVRSRLLRLGRPAVLAVAAILDLTPDHQPLERIWALFFELDQSTALQSLRSRIDRRLGIPQYLLSMLVKVGNPQAAEIAVGALALQERQHRHAHRSAILHLGMVALEPLSQAFRQDRVLRDEEVDLLAKIGGQIVVDQLLTGLQDTESHSARVLYEAALLRLGPAATNSIVSAYTRSNLDTRLRMIGILSKIGAPAAIEILQRAAGQPGELQAPSIAGLGADQTEKSKEIVLTASKSQQPKLRAAAAAALSLWGVAEAVVPLQSLALDASLEVMNEAFRAIEQLARGGKESARLVTLTLLHLCALINSDVESAELVRLLMGTLVTIGDVDTLTGAVNGDIPNAQIKLQIESIVARGEVRTAPFLRAADLSGGTRAESQQMLLRQPAESSSTVDDVHFSVTAPSMISRGNEFVLEIWAHLDRHRALVLRRAREDLGTERIYRQSAGPHPVARGTQLQMQVTIPGLHFTDEESLYWNGKVCNATCLVPVPHDVSRGLQSGMVQFFVGPFRIARVHFSVLIGDFSTDAEDRTLLEERVRTAFASYATEDRERVLSRIQGMLKVVPTLDVFLDAISLRSGDDWMRRIEEEIASRDVFYLFWSRFAKQSQYVEREWRTALKGKGLDSIEPVPLESPTNAPPPIELASLHFHEWTLAVRPN